MKIRMRAREVTILNFMIILKDNCTSASEESEDMFETESSLSLFAREF